MYNSLKNLEFQNGVKLIGYVDVVEQPTVELMQIIANESLIRCNKWLRYNILQLAVSKRKAILVTSRRISTKLKIQLQCKDIHFKRNFCYLGAQLDNRLCIGQLFCNIRNKFMCTAMSLSRMMPICGGPKPHKGKWISSVIHSELLYAAPTFVPQRFTKKQSKGANKIKKD